jgi:hypothetical protein
MLIHVWWSAGKDLEGSSFGGLIEILYRYLPGGTEETCESLGVGSVSVEIRSKHLPNTNVEYYRYTNLLGDVLLFIFNLCLNGGGRTQTRDLMNSRLAP